MNENITREKILDLLDTVEHPEIACSLPELGMILDVALEGDLVHVAIALPMPNIMDSVRLKIEQDIADKFQVLNLELQAEYFPMLPEVREKFFSLARTKWKGTV